MRRIHFGRKGGNGRKRRTKQKRRLHGQTFVIQIPKQIGYTVNVEKLHTTSTVRNLTKRISFPSPIIYIYVYISSKVLSGATIDAQLSVEKIFSEIKQQQQQKHFLSSIIYIFLRFSLKIQSITIRWKNIFQNKTTTTTTKHSLPHNLYIFSVLSGL